jgi:hypothetical protein
MPWTLQITARMGCELSQELLPVDVTDFLMHARSVKEDLASVITLAMFKEPSATAAFMRTCQPRMSDPSISPQEVAGELISVLRQVEQSDTELEVLGAQGVARCTGLASTCRAYFRIIARAPHTDPKKTKKKKMGQQISNKQPAKMRSTCKKKRSEGGPSREAAQDCGRQISETQERASEDEAQSCCIAGKDHLRKVQDRVLADGRDRQHRPIPRRMPSTARCLAESVGDEGSTAGYRGSLPSDTIDAR